MKNVILKFQDPFPVFMHISDIEGEFIPRKGDRVRYQVCPMPPRFDKPQGVHIQIIDFTPEVHKKWSEKETPEELKEDLEAMKEERELSEQLKGPGPLINTSGTYVSRRLFQNVWTSVHLRTLPKMYNWVSRLA